ncbi:MAG: hypothetical protein J6S14_10945 [Clostridia bacterium]|nr:hypothetical protein [Clostridia bacterium]
MRYIEIDSIIAQIRGAHCDRCKHNRCTVCDIDEVLLLLEEADDADVEEVVRCKDCKHCDEYQNFNFERYLGCNTNGEIYKVEPNHFCSYGERKEDG